MGFTKKQEKLIIGFNKTMLKYKIKFKKANMSINGRQTIIDDDGVKRDWEDVLFGVKENEKNKD